jgi:hypothetical protein
MPTRRPVDATPDLFALASKGATERKIEPDHRVTEPHLFLPKDLAGALKRLHDTEIDALLSAVTAEAKRRNRLLPKPSQEPAPRNARLQLPSAGGVASLTTAKLNAVRAAFKAGVKPSTIARQFGVSQSDVRKALATGKR